MKYAYMTILRQKQQVQCNTFKFKGLIKNILVISLRSILSICLSESLMEKSFISIKIKTMHTSDKSYQIFTYCICFFFVFTTSNP